MQSLKISMAGLAVFGVALALAPQASAVVVFEDDFESTTPGNEPAGWTSVDNNGVTTANGTTTSINVAAGENSPFGPVGDNQALRFFDQDATILLIADRPLSSPIDGRIKVSYDVKFDTAVNEYALALVGDLGFPSASLVMGSSRSPPANGNFINNRGGSFDLLELAKADIWYHIEILTSDITLGTVATPLDTVTYSIQEFGQAATVYAPLPFRRDTSEFNIVRFLGNTGPAAQIVSLIDNLKVEIIAAGDFDNNGIVNGNDFLLWQRDTSIGNLADWEANYGTGSGALAASAAVVPEPTTTVLLGFAVAVVTIARRCKSFEFSCT